MSLYTQPEFYNGYGNASLAPTGQNPPIVPPMDPIVGFPDLTGGGEVLAFQSRSQYLTQFPRVPAQGLWVVGGTITIGDLVPLTVTCGLLPGGSVTVTTMAVSGDTTDTIASRLIALLNANALLQSYGVYATKPAASHIALFWPGPVGNHVTLSGTPHSYEETATIGGSETDGDVLTLTGAFASPAPATAVITVGGTKTTGDVFAVTFENPLLPNGSVTHKYTVLSGDTLATIATAIQGLIAADTHLTALGMTSNVAGTSIYMAWSPPFGNIYIDLAVSHAAGTTLAFASNAGSPPSPLAPSPLPTESITVGGTPATGDVITITALSPAMAPTTAKYTVAPGDTTTLVAAGIAAALEAANSNLTATNGATHVVTVSWPTVIGSVAFSGTAAGAFTGALSVVQAPASVSVSYTTQTGDDLNAIAAALDAAVNANVVMAANQAVATVAAAVVSLHYNGLQNVVTWTESTSVGATETITLAAASGAATETLTPTNPTGGAGPVIAVVDFQTSFAEDPVQQVQVALGVATTGVQGACGSCQSAYFYAGKPYPNLDDSTLSILIRDALPIM